MAWEDIVERMEGMGWLGMGLGAVILAPALIPAVGRGLRPAAKNAVKGYLALSDRVREWAGEGTERWQDLVAEAKSEYDNRANGAEMMEMASESGAGAKGGHHPHGEGEEARHRSRGGRKEEEGKPEAA
jgi:hypothetical protein